MKKIASLLMLGTIGLAGCSHDRGPGSSHYDPEHPGYNYEFEGDMYYAVPYEALSSWSNHYIQVNPDSINLRLPVKGTIARGKLGFNYHLPNSLEGYNAAAGLQNPLPASVQNIEEGKVLYSKYCWQCHGATGEGDGPVIAAGKFPAPSWKTYKSPYIQGLPMGQMFHTITYGKNLMGSHASQLHPTERWKIIHFIKALAMEGGAAPAADAPKEGAQADSVAATPIKGGKNGAEAKGVARPEKQSDKKTDQSPK